MFMAFRHIGKCVSKKKKDLHHKSSLKIPLSDILHRDGRFRTGKRKYDFTE